MLKNWLPQQLNESPERSVFCICDFLAGPCKDLSRTEGKVHQELIAQSALWLLARVSALELFLFNLLQRLFCC
jgi:hypothetical protein